MNTFPPIRLAAAVAVLLLASLAAAFAQQEPAAVSAQTSAYRDSIAQDELRANTARVKDDLGLLLEDYQQTQTTADERGQLQDALQKLGSLSDKDMAAVVDTLRAASTQDNTAALQDRLVTASRGQKNIQSLLRALSDRLARQQTQQAMQGRLQALVLRQTVNLREMKEAADGKSPHPSTALLGAEQNGIQNDIAQALDAMQKTNADPNAAKDTGFTGAMKEAQDRQLAAAAATAATAAATGKFPDAVAAQEKVLDGARAMLQHVQSAQTLQERFQGAANRMRDLASEQKTFAETVRNADPASHKDLHDAQQRLADRVAALRQEVAALDANAAVPLHDAENTMTDAVEKLKDPNSLKESKHPAKGKNGAPTPPDAKTKLADTAADAAAKLEATGAALDKQAADAANAARTAPASAAEALAALQNLGQQVGQVLDAQKALAATLAANPALPNAAAQQGQLATAATALQQRAQAVAPQAAGELGAAADNMKQAGQSPPNAQDPAAKAQAAQAAADQLAQARAAVQQQIQKVALAADAEKPVDLLMAQLVEVKAQVVAADQSMLGTPTGPLMEALQQTQTAEGTLQQAQVAAAQAGDLVPMAAKENMQQAAQTLMQSRLLAAQPQRDRAMATNVEAQHSLDLAMQLLQKAKAQAIAQALPPPSASVAQNSPQAQQPNQAQSARPQSGPQQAGQQQNGQQKGAQPPTGQPQGGQQQNGPQKGGQPPDGQPGGDKVAGQPGGKQNGSQGSKQNGDGKDNHDGKDPGGPSNEGAVRGFLGYANLPGSGPAQTATGIKPRDRDAILLLEKEVPPAEYSSMVRQYTKNLANGVSPENVQP